MFYIYRKILFVSFFVFSFSAICSGSPTPHSNRVETEVRVVSFDLVEGFVLITATIDGIEGRYILDTGSRYIMINRDIKTSSIDLTSLGRELQAEEIEIGTFRIGDLTRENMTALALDLSFAEELLGFQINGLIGSDILDGFDVLIDYSNSELRFFRDRQIQVDVTKYHSVSLSYSVCVEKLPVVNVSLNGNVFKFGFDTGSNANVLDRKHKDILFPTVEIQDNEISYFVDMKLKKVRIDNAPFIFHDMSTYNIPPGRALDGILSVSSINADLIFIDAHHEKIHIFWDKNKSANQLELTQESN